MLFYGIFLAKYVSVNFMRGFLGLKGLIPIDRCPVNEGDQKGKKSRQMKPVRDTSRFIQRINCRGIR